MRTSSSNFLNSLLLFFLLSLSPVSWGQKADSTSKKEADSSELSMNMDAPYQRPFRTVKKMPVNLGGYLEVNSLYQASDGVSEGLSFQARRLTLFMSSSIGRRLSFLSEIEFEAGGEEIAIEFAAVDIAFHPLLNLRGGIVMNPIAGFNQNHDGPKWEFVERPDVAVDLLPATWSNAGFGLYGKAYAGNWIFGYEAYLTNGFDGTIIDNERNKTFLPASKHSGERFEESFNGKPLLTGKLAIKYRGVGEIGLSYMGGIYNKFKADGLKLAPKRRVDVLAADLRFKIAGWKTRFIGELAYDLVDVPETYTQRYGEIQRGAFLDIIQPILDRPMFGWKKARLNLAARFNYVDWNVGTFERSGSRIGDERLALTPAISFRPSSRTVLRLNYRYQWQWDLLRNPPAHEASWMLGLSSYF
ncbi:MAG: hypothetical protein ABEH38_01705 [Flavobacteriales bacterium]